MLREPASPHCPVGLLDDDPGKRHFRILEVPVLGNRNSLAKVAATVDASTLLIAMPSAHGTTLRELTRLAESAGQPILAAVPAGGASSRELARTDGAALIVAAGDPAALAAAVTRLQQESTARIEMGRRGRVYAAQHLGPATAAARVSAFATHLLAVADLDGDPG